MKIPPTKLSLKDDNTYTINGSQKKKKPISYPICSHVPVHGQYFRP